MEEEVNPGACFFRRKEAEAPYILSVHAENEVETHKVLRAHLPAYLTGNVDAVALGHRNRTRIRGLAHVPVAEACRIDLEGILQTPFGQSVAEDTFGKR